jgi:hypothetical protein
MYGSLIGGGGALLLRLLLGILVNLGVFLGIPFLIGRVVGYLYRLGWPTLGCAQLRCEETLRSPGWTGVAIFFLLFMGLVSVLIDLLFRPSAEFWWRRLQRWSGMFLALAVVAVVALRLIPKTLWWTRQDHSGLAGDVSHLVHGRGSISAAVVTTALSLGRLVFRSRPNEDVLREKLARLPRRLRIVLTRMATYVLVAVPLVVFVLFAIDSGTRRWSNEATAWWVGILAVLTAMFAFGNPITWSPQPFYKRQLQTVFALERHTDADGGVTVGRIPTDHEPFLSRLRPTHWPQLLICAAANVSDVGFTPPGLSYTSFVFSPDHVGGPLVGSIPTREYEAHLTRIRFFQKVWNMRHLDSPSLGRLLDVSPLSAVSITGSAVVPSVGRLNQPVHRVLNVLLNLRAGVWLANPRMARELQGDSPTFKPLIRPTYAVRELLGRNNLHSRYLYVVDGGHYESLGIVELLRRGCTTIYAVDACGTAPGSIRELGHAVALARAELGVEFDGVDPSMFVAAKIADPNAAETDHAIIHYRFPAGGGKGTLVYIRKALVEDDATPADLIAYQRSHPAFPYDLSTDQFDDAGQFEAYRALGAFVTRHALESGELSPSKTS